MECLESLLGPADSAVTLCAANGTQLDLWMASNGDIAHNSRMPDRGSFWAPTQESSWQATATLGKPVAPNARPDIVYPQSPPDTYYCDLVAYADDESARYCTATGWMPAGILPARFLAEPTLLSTSTDRYDFFGLRDDGVLWHYILARGEGMSPFRKIGGPLGSVASAVVTAGGQIDIIALGVGNSSAACHALNYLPAHLGGSWYSW
jgi:hypothetical protein